MGRISAVALSVAIGLALTPMVLEAQGLRELQGEVFWVEDGERRTEAGLQVLLREVDKSDTTNDHGLFRLALPGFFKTGETVTLIVRKPGWLIYRPLGGEVRIPHDPRKEVVQVELLPKGSKLFLGHDQIERLIEEVADESRRQARQEEKGASVDFSRAIRDWAERYGLGVDEAKAEIDRWIAEVEATSDDERKLGLAEFAKENFDQAAHHFELSRRGRQERLAELERQEARIQERKEELHREVARDLQLEGSAYYNAQRFEEATAAYREIFQYIDREERPHLWATTQNNLGIALRAQGIRTGGAEEAHLLEQAVDTYRRALEVFTREDLPQQWATTQNSLGNALSDQGIRTAGAEGVRLLEQAVHAYRRALEVRNREDLPQDWAMTHNNLGAALQAQGIRTGGAEGARLLEQAVHAYRRALEVYTREDLPQDWAMTQNNLGIALRAQGIRTGGAEGAHLLEQAIDAQRRALEVYTREDLPQQWAGTQNNLGNALRAQGIRTGGAEGAHLLEQAVDAYRRALEVRNREDLPQQWAITQNNLGAALRNQGIRTGGAEGAHLLEQAVDTYRRALEVRNREDLPQQWAITQNNLGKALEALGRLEEAASTYRELLSEQPNLQDVTYNLIALYHDGLYDYDAAHALVQDWLRRFPSDMGAQVQLTESLFTTGRYDGCEEQARKIAEATSEVPRLDGVQRGFEVAALLARDDVATATDRLADLTATLSDQPEDFTTGWSVSGTLHFVRMEQDLRHRGAVLRLFESLEAGHRDAILDGLREVHERLQAATEPAAIR